MDRWFYWPDRYDYLQGHPPAIKPEPVQFQSLDGTALFGWYLHAEGQRKGVIVHLHGNAQNLSAHHRQVDWLALQGFDVLVFDYRGYGQSQGHPSRRGVFEDAVAAVKYAQSRVEAQGQPLYLLGQSLGGAIALAVAGSGQVHGLAGVVSDSAFSSYRGIVADKASQIPLLGWMLKYLVPPFVSSDYSPDAYVAHIAPVPLLLIHGDRDATVPVANAERLYALAGQPKLEWVIRGAGHIESLSRFRPWVGKPLIDFFDYCRTGDKSALEQDGVAVQALNNARRQN